MIAIVSSNSRERTALSALCEQSSWPFVPCDSLRALRKLLRQTTPSVVLTRSKLPDGYSDDVLALVDASSPTGSRTIVLCPADVPSALAARQIALGADCVLRDPVHMNILAAYLGRHAQAKTANGTGPVLARPFPLASASIDPIERTVNHAGKQAQLTQRECELALLFHESNGALLSYQTLYSELLGRNFHGDTSNMRVLFGKLAGSFRRVGIEFRDHVSVIPKTGYRLRPDGPPAGGRRRPDAGASSGTGRRT